MNSDFNSNSPSLSSRRSWAWIVGVSTLVGTLSWAMGAFFLWPPLGLLVALFFTGAVAGALSTRQSWLSGIIVGLPLALEQLTRHTLHEFGTVSVAFAHVDYWRLVLPVSLVATGIAILGALSGAWLLGPCFRAR